MNFNVRKLELNETFENRIHRMKEKTETLLTSANFEGYIWPLSARRHVQGNTLVVARVVFAHALYDQRFSRISQASATAKEKWLAIFVPRDIRWRVTHWRLTEKYHSSVCIYHVMRLDFSKVPEKNCKT